MLLFLFSCFLFFSFLFLVVGGNGDKETGLSHYDRSFLSGPRIWVFLENPAAAMALRAACSGISNTRLQKTKS